MQTIRTALRVEKCLIVRDLDGRIRCSVLKSEICCLFCFPCRLALWINVLPRCTCISFLCRFPDSDHSGLSILSSVIL